jgi:hypothetical protein
LSATDEAFVGHRLADALTTGHQQRVDLAPAALQRVRGDELQPAGADDRSAVAGRHQLDPVRAAASGSVGL